MTQQQLKILQSYPNFKAFMELFKPAQLLVQYDDIMTIEDSLSRQRITLKNISEMYSDDKFDAGVDYMMQWLKFLNDFSNINKPLTDVKAVGYMIFKRYYHLYLPDLKILLEEIMYRKYGTFYGSVDAQLILSAFKAYDDERRVIQKRVMQKLNIEFEAYADQCKKQIGKEVFKEMGESYHPTEHAWRCSQRWEKVKDQVREEWMETHGSK